MRFAIVVVAAASCGRGDPPANVGAPERVEEPPRAAAPKPVPPPPPKFAFNAGRDVLVEHGVTLAPTAAGAWEGRWIGKQLLGGPVSGELGVDMTITRDRDGRIVLTQSALGITVVQRLLPSPDSPQIAAGITHRTQHVGEVTFTSREELTAVVATDHLAIGMVVTTEDPGEYRGQRLPAPPPRKSFTLLDRKR